MRRPIPEAAPVTTSIRPEKRSNGGMRTSIDVRHAGLCRCQNEPAAALQVVHVLG